MYRKPIVNLKICGQRKFCQNPSRAILPKLYSLHAIKDKRDCKEERVARKNITATRTVIWALTGAVQYTKFMS